MKHWITVGLAASVLMTAGVATDSASASEDASAAPRSGSVSLDQPTTRGATEVVGGGVWTYFVGGGEVVSAYDNGKFEHSTTVKSANSSKSNRVAKGKIAYAATPSTWWGGNRAYWNIY